MNVGMSAWSVYQNCGWGPAEIFAHELAQAQTSVEHVRNITEQMV